MAERTTVRLFDDETLERFRRVMPASDERSRGGGGGLFAKRNPARYLLQTSRRITLC